MENARLYPSSQLIPKPAERPAVFLLQSCPTPPSQTRYFRKRFLSEVIYNPEKQSPCASAPYEDLRFSLYAYPKIQKKLSRNLGALPPAEASAKLIFQPQIVRLWKQTPEALL